ncbi:acetamidase/formamidase family protein [Methylibium sp.]|uniref:acetamidase/formamidase family protein n=3 Tax=Methylibium sp. TaxID=2067992 RepID=UPI003D0CD742
MLDDLRRFSTDAFPEDLRPAAWAEVMAKVLMAPAAPAYDAPPLAGYVSARSSALESVFARLSSSPQVWLPHPGNTRRGGHTVLMLALLEGSGLVVEGQESVALAAGGIVLLDPARPWRVELNTDFRAVVIRLESASFVLRLVRTSGQDLNTISPKTGVGAVCLNLVRSIADELDQLGRHELLPIEATLMELLVTCLSHVDDEDAQAAAAPDDSTSVQLGHLRRVCRTVEARLGDAELTLEAVAALEGLSPRYIQKLFKAASASFGEYLKARRLERCRLDLANRALAHFTIAELCFRWGFGDAANFSRAFTARFGLSPKAYRAAPPADVAAGPTQRGAPAAGVTTTTSTRAAAAADTPEARRRQFEAVLTDHERYALALALAPKRAVPHAAEAVLPEALPGAEHAPEYYYIPVSDQTVHWGYLSRTLKPVISVRSGDVVTIETLTQHASDDRERMIDGDPGAESVFHWTATRKAVVRRGAGPMDASVFGRGAGEGFGVHICTGPVHVRGAEPGDVLEVRILDIRARPSCHPQHRGKLFGSNAAAWWGYQYHDLLTEPKKREVVTLYELQTDVAEPYAKAVYSFRWTPQTDPDGVRHETIDYPGVPVDPASVDKLYGVLAKARVPIRPHFGLLAVAPKESGLIDSVPPGYFGGNLDNWRAGKGARLFLPVSVEGALFSVGDPHASQGDGEVCGTAIECSLTGSFQLVLHKRAQIADGFLADLNHPFLDAEDAWVVQGFSFANHLAELGPQAQTQVYQKSSLDLAMRDAFRKARRYLMQAHGLDEDEALSLMSVAVDFGVTQVADGNWGVHAVIRKAIFPPQAEGEGSGTAPAPSSAPPQPLRNRKL